MKTNKKIYLFIVLIVSVLSVSMPSCGNDEDVQAKKVILNVFGPSPALRGSTIKFIGTNMDKVSSIVLPDNIEVTDIAKSGTTEITITIPQETKPGYITLKTPSGDIKTITTLTFREPISIDTYTTTSVKAGDSFIITGDYLNNVAKVVFSNEVAVDSANFVSQTRKKIELKVPKRARSGKLYLATGEQIPTVVYSSGIATITDPTTLASLSPATVKAGANLTITGTNLDLVKSVIIPDGIKIDSANITLNSAKTQLTVKVPEKAKEGSVKIVTYSGTEMTVAQTLKLVKPAITTLSATTVKNGSSLKITGTDLDLVTTIGCSGGANAVISSQSETEINLTIPLTATDGVLTLNTNSGLTTTSAALTIVKPTFSTISPLSLIAGDVLTISGTDLDLVRTVYLPGGSVAVTPAAGATSLTITVPATCVGTGSVTFETVNGTKVSSTDQLTIKASTTPSISGVTSYVAAGGLMIITGKNLNNVESIVFEDNVKAVLYGTRSETEIRVYIPLAAKHGTTTFTISSFDGEKIVSPAFNYVVEPTQDSKYMLFDFDNWGIGWNSFGTAVTGSLALSNKYYYVDETALSNSWYTLFCSNWGQYNVNGITKSNGVIKMDINILDVDPTLHLKFRINEGWYIWNIGSDFPSRTSNGWITVTFPLSAFGGLTDNDLSTSVVNGAHVETSLTSGWIDGGGTAKLKMAVDNVRIEKITSNQAPKFKLTGF